MESNASTYPHYSLTPTHVRYQLTVFVDVVLPSVLHFSDTRLVQDQDRVMCRCPNHRVVAQAQIFNQ